MSGKIPGAYLLIGRNDKIAFAQGFGVQGPGQATPMSEETIFRVFSMTKPIVTVTAMTLVEEGKLGVDDPVSKYLPEFANVHVLQTDGVANRRRADAGPPPDEPHLRHHLLLHPAQQPLGSHSRCRRGRAAKTSRAKDGEDVVASCRSPPSPARPGTIRSATDVLGAVDRGGHRQVARRCGQGARDGPAGHDRHGLLPACGKRARFAQSKTAGSALLRLHGASPFMQAAAASRRRRKTICASR